MEKTDNVYFFLIWALHAAILVYGILIKYSPRRDYLDRSIRELIWILCLISAAWFNTVTLLFRH